MFNHKTSLRSDVYVTKYYHCQYCFSALYIIICFQMYSFSNNTNLTSNNSNINISKAVTCLQVHNFSDNITITSNNNNNNNNNNST